MFLRGRQNGTSLPFLWPRVKIMCLLVEMCCSLWPIDYFIA
jgi:hypothetical protein